MNFLLQSVGIKENTFNRVHSYKGIEFIEPLINFTSILTYLKEHVKKQGNDPFIIEITRGTERQIVNYKDFYLTLLKVGYILKNTYNVNLNTKAAILPDNTVASIYIILGVMLCGGTSVLINPNEPLGRIKQQIEKVGSSITIIDSLSQNSGINFTVTAQEIVEKSNKLPYLPDNININSYHPALIIFTTGTTSTSKPVVQMHYNLAINCYALASHHQLDNKQRLLCTLPIYHVNGLEFTLFSSMIAGSSVVLCDNFDPFKYLDLIERYKVTIASLVPSMLDLITEESSVGFDLSNLRYFVTAAAPLSTKTSNAIWKKFKKVIIQGYGLTETTNFSTIMPININEDAYKVLMLDCDIPSVGPEIFGNEVLIFKSDGTLAKEGEEGEVCMRGHNVMAGYLYNSQATMKCFKGGWFHSGDIGKFISLPSSQQKFLKITGRIKNIIKISGHAVSLDEIDRLILNIEGVQDCITCAIDDPTVGELPLSFVVRKNDFLTETHILSCIAKSINQQSLPKTIIFVPHIPRMKNGKINRFHVMTELLKSV